MNLYIKVQDGYTVDHPHLESNLSQIIEEFDSDNLPDGWAKFIRVLNPHNEQLLYNEFVSHSYEFDSANNAWTDTWTVETMTEEALANKKESHKVDVQKEFQPHIDNATNMINSFSSNDELTKNNKRMWVLHLQLLNSQLTKYLDSFNLPDGPGFFAIPPLPTFNPNINYSNQLVEINNKGITRL